jgi:DNA-binding transcriptional LysR family regulator
LLELLDTAVHPELSWDDLRVLVAVGQAGSLNRAAAALDMTQPTISRRMSRLETSLGVRLVVRGPQGVELTSVGRRLFEAAATLNDTMTQAVKSAKTGESAAAAEVKLSVQEGLAAYWLPRFLPQFHADRPEIALKLFATNEVADYSRLFFDVQIHFVPVQDPDTQVLCLGKLHFIPVASREYLAHYGMPQDREDLAFHRLLDFTQYFVDRTQWTSWLADADLTQRVRVLTNAASVLGECVRQGSGIALVPTYATLIDSDLIPIEIEGLKYESQFWLSYRRASGRIPAVRAVINFLKAVFDRRRMPWFADDYVSPNDARFRLAATAMGHLHLPLSAAISETDPL